MSLYVQEKTAAKERETEKFFDVSEPPSGPSSPPWFSSAARSASPSLLVSAVFTA